MNADDPFKPAVPPMRHMNIHQPTIPPAEATIPVPMVTMPLADWYTARDLARRDGFGVGFMLGVILASTGFTLLVLFT